MRQVTLKHQWDSLGRIGVAAEYFPDYRQPVISMHGVDVLLLTVVLAGQGVHYLGEQRYAESGNSVAVTHYGEAHSIVTAPGTAMEIVNIYLDWPRLALPPLPEELRSGLEALLPARPQWGSRRLLRIEFPDMTVPGMLARGIARELAGRRQGYLSCAMDYFRLFLIECGRQIVRSGLAEVFPLDAGARKVEQLCRYLEEHPERDIPLAELAARTGWQQNYLCRRFRRHTGKSISRYRIELRIQRAIYELRHTDEKILAIAWKSGFRDLSYFSRAFKAVTGLPPHRFRAEAAPDPAGKSVRGFAPKE